MCCSKTAHRIDLKPPNMPRSAASSWPPTCSRELAAGSPYPSPVSLALDPQNFPKQGLQPRVCAAVPDGDVLSASVNYCNKDNELIRATLVLLLLHVG